MSTRNERFNASMRSLDEFTASFEDPTKITALSDNGQGVERMLDEIDRTETTGFSTGRTGVLPVQLENDNIQVQNVRDARSPEKLHRAEMRLYRAGLDNLVRVLRLIVKNGKNRKESIGELARSSRSPKAAERLYFSHREKILKFFLGQ